MKRFKRVIALLCAAATLAGGVFALSGCNNNSDKDDKGGKIDQSEQSTQSLGKPVAPAGAVDVSLNDIESEYNAVLSKLRDTNRTEGETVQFYTTYNSSSTRKHMNIGVNGDTLLSDATVTEKRAATSNLSYAAFGSISDFNGATTYEYSDNETRTWNKKLPQEFAEEYRYYSDSERQNEYEYNSLATNGKIYCALTGSYFKENNEEDKLGNPKLVSISPQNNYYNRYQNTIMPIDRDGTISRDMLWGFGDSTVFGAALNYIQGDKSDEYLKNAVLFNYYNPDDAYYINPFIDIGISKISLEMKKAGSKMYLRYFVEFKTAETVNSTYNYSETTSYEDFILIDTDANVTEQTLPLGKIGDTKVTADNFKQLTSKDILYVDYDGTPAQLEEKLLAKQPVTLKALGGGDTTKLECTLLIRDKTRHEYPLTPDENGEIKITAEMLASEDEIFILSLGAKYSGENNIWCECYLCSYYKNN